MSAPAAPAAADRVPAARIPGSKSITNRALLLAASANGTSRLRAPLVSDDTVAFRDALIGLGARITAAPGDTHWEVTGQGHGPVGGGRVRCADAGTAARFLPPFAATGSGDYVFDGSEQLRARPLAPLLDALTRLRVRGNSAPGGRLPLRVEASGLWGGELYVDGGMSSQYVSGLLMAAPLMRCPLTVRTRDLVSRPYVDMTIALMRDFGARVDELADGVTRIAADGYAAADLDIEPDASTASYLLAAAAVTGRGVTVPGLGHDSLQGDLRFVEVLRRAGALVEWARTPRPSSGPRTGGCAAGSTSTWARSRTPS